ncbi:MAG: SRPBCC domain-containing protein [Chryseolinea sp.]
MNTDMKELEFSTQIAAPKKKVWDTMLNLDTYKKWTDAAWPGSTYEGKWKEGSDIKFIGADSSGTLATITEITPLDHIVAKHVAILQKGGVEDRTSELASRWVGTTESYYFDETNGKTNLKIKMKVTPEWEQEFKNSWPKALDKLKEMSEH